MKTCKQCGRDLPVDSFRPYAARGRGIYNTKQGRNTICKECESISSRCAAAIKKGDEALLDKFKSHYAALQERGYEPVTAPAKKLLGIVDNSAGTGASTIAHRRRTKSLDDLMSGVLGISETQVHLDKLRSRSYLTFEEAEQTHLKLESSLRATGLYEEASDLLDAWFMEG